MFHSDLIIYTHGNCNTTCAVNVVVEYLCAQLVVGRATCTEASTWNETCTPVGK